MQASPHTPHTSPRTGVDLRGFAYPLQGVLRRQQWQLDGLRAAWAKCQRATRDARQRLARLDADLEQAREAANAHWRQRPDASLHRGYIAYLARLQAERQRLCEQIDALAREQALAREACQRQRQRLSATERHRDAALDDYAQAQTRLAAAEADRDWLSRVAARTLTAASPSGPERPAP